MWGSLAPPRYGETQAAFGLRADGAASGTGIQDVDVSLPAAQQLLRTYRVSSSASVTEQRAALASAVNNEFFGRQGEWLRRSGGTRHWQGFEALPEFALLRREAAAACAEYLAAWGRDDGDVSQHRLYLWASVHMDGETVLRVHVATTSCRVQNSCAGGPALTP